MLLVSLTFVYIFALSAQTGIAVNKWLSLKNPDPFITAFTGLFAIATWACGWAFFGHINWEFQLVLLSVNVFLFLRYRPETAAFYHQFFSGIKSLPVWLKLVFAATTILIIAKTSGMPFLPDNESYYIQTIKWLNEFGLVPGLANLHFFFGQTSGWHIAQSVFSFSFFNDKFNDLSAFALFLGNGFCVFKWRDFLKSGSFTALVFALCGCANILLFQFISSPSPDLPVYIIAFFTSWLFVENFERPTASVVRQLTVMVVFAAFIKLTSIAFLLLPVLLLFRTKTFSLRTELPMIATCVVTFGLFVSKNLVLSGYAFFPMPMLSTNSGSAVPKIILDYFAMNTRPMAFYLDAETYAAASQMQLLIRWLRLPGLHGIFNILSLLALLIPIPVLFARKEKSWWQLYAVFVVQWLLLFCISPQYRFGLHGTLILGMFVVAFILRHRKKIAVGMFILATAASAVPVFVPIGMASVSANALFKENPVLSKRQLVYAHANSSEQTTFNSENVGNLNYFSPAHPTFMWFTGNGPLPCVNKEQIEFFERNFGYRPQRVGTEISDGFYNARVDGNKEPHR